MQYNPRGIDQYQPIVVGGNPIDDTIYSIGPIAEQNAMRKLLSASIRTST